MLVEFVEVVRIYRHDVTGHWYGVATFRAFDAPEVPRNQIEEFSREFKFLVQPAEVDVVGAAEAFAVREHAARTEAGAEG